jgi:NTP pyrophosphatase (non-canonical NTP hydrolase)
MALHFNEYQFQAADFALPTALDSKNYLLPGLTGEVGELMSLFAKAHRDGTIVEQDQITKELGDCLWFIAVIAKVYDISLLEVAEKNLEKLASRQKRGTITGSGDNR